MWNIIEGVRNDKYFLLLLLLGKTLTPLTPYSYSPALLKSNSHVTVYNIFNNNVFAFSPLLCIVLVGTKR